MSETTSTPNKVFRPKKNAAKLIVRPVYDQTHPIESKNGNPFGLPSNLDEQRESWRELVPLHKNSKDVNERLFKVGNISDHARSRFLGPASTQHLANFDSVRRASVRSAQCLALILITEKGEGNEKQGELDYNWALCAEVFGAAFTKQYREFIRRVRSHPNGQHDRWTWVSGLASHS